MGDLNVDDTAVAGDKTEAKPEFKPIESQDDLNRIVQERLARERAKYSDYDEIKARAAKLDEIEAANQSDLEKAIARAEAAEKRAEEIERAKTEAERAVLVERIASTKGVPSRYLTGDTEEELKKSADEFLSDLEKLSPRGYVPTAGTGDPTASADDIQLAKERAAKYKI
ncbi:uncharacterized protein DUF4355 [Brevibacterium sanguinis]|uniref:Uncharacterized protein DUF4355 n=2 Tax=Brevibacterium TaxID=1696 RepID=A0A366IKZ4_9MICO|nr:MULTISPECIES: DUF4355 domain-containing protein [Brevibacterium]RBP66430.1 uncharacterized protein DUF4355 [Brevibacterium sanguinis]RBP73082.1 uncharacterized protein DUF4355 [Brevibacterium celere]